MNSLGGVPPPPEGRFIRNHITPTATTKATMITATATPAGISRRMIDHLLPRRGALPLSRIHIEAGIVEVTQSALDVEPLGSHRPSAAPHEPLHMPVHEANRVALLVAAVFARVRGRIRGVLRGTTAVFTWWAHCKRYAEAGSVEAAELANTHPNIGIGSQQTRLTRKER